MKQLSGKQYGCPANNLVVWQAVRLSSTQSSYLASQAAFGVHQAIRLFGKQSRCPAGNPAVLQAIQLSGKQSGCLASNPVDSHKPRTAKGLLGDCQDSSRLRSACKPIVQHSGCPVGNLVIWQAIRLSGKQSRCLASNLAAWHILNRCGTVWGSGMLLFQRAGRSAGLLFKSHIENNAITRSSRQSTIFCNFVSLSKEA